MHLVSAFPFFKKCLYLNRYSFFLLWNVYLAAFGKWKLVLFVYQWNWKHLMEVKFAVQSPLLFSYKNQHDYLWFSVILLNLFNFSRGIISRISLEQRKICRPEFEMRIWMDRDQNLINIEPRNLWESFGNKMFWLLEEGT